MATAHRLLGLMHSGQSEIGENGEEDARRSVGQMHGDRLHIQVLL